MSTKTAPSEESYTILSKVVKDNISFFQIPIKQDAKTNFPDFLHKALKNYSSFYKETLKQYVDDIIRYDGDEDNVMEMRINTLSTTLVKVVNDYYDGNVLKATLNFNKALQEGFFNQVVDTHNIEIGKSFYRARASSGQQLDRKGLYHIAFNVRHLVSTNRYSIPGLPALYVGDNAYICWEEFNRHKLRDLYFSRLESKINLKVIRLQRIEDFFEELDNSNIDKYKKHTLLLRYLSIFPLLISCTIKVLYKDGSFKPEYILPQLLLQYVSDESNKIDGIMFPSTKVAYGKLHRFSPYNYVFPARKMASDGFCSDLSKALFITEPTSLELEEVIYNVTHPSGIHMGRGNIPNPEYIELINGEKTYYGNTSFGRIEQSLKLRTAHPVC